MYDLLSKLTERKTNRMRTVFPIKNIQNSKLSLALSASNVVAFL